MDIFEDKSLSEEFIFKRKILYLAMCNWSHCRSLDFDKCFYCTNIRDENYKFQ